jgi:hypothetical protein
MPEGQPEAMIRHWHQSGKTVDGGPCLPWHVSLYVPLVVLMLIKGFDSRQMEAYLAENVVARVFIGRHRDLKAQIRDPSNIAKAYAALGKEGIDEVNTFWLWQRGGSVGRHHSAGTAHWLSQRTGHLAGAGTALWPAFRSQRRNFGGEGMTPYRKSTCKPPQKTLDF